MINLTTTIQEITLQAYHFGVYNYLFSERTHNLMTRDEIFNLFEEWGKEFEDCHGEDFDWEMNPYYDEIDDFVLYKFDSIKAKDRGIVIGAYIAYESGLYKVEGFTDRGISVMEILPTDNKEWEVAEIGFNQFKYVEVADPDHFGIMDTTQSHDKELVNAINKAWVENPARFKPILIALYTRDIKEIADSEAWDFDAVLDLKGVSGSRKEELEEILAYLKTHWIMEAENYLMHIADDTDLRCILDFIRYSD